MLGRPQLWCAQSINILFNGKVIPMGKHRAISTERRAGGLLLGAVASGALAAAACGSAGTANATCASISGVGNGNGCTSAATSFAVGLGNNSTANAEGLFNGAVAVGDGSLAEAAGVGAFGTPGTGNVALSVGTNVESIAAGTGNLAIAAGDPGANPGSTSMVFSCDHRLVPKEPPRSQEAPSTGHLRSATAAPPTPTAATKRTR
jgi:hypothetical protein